MKWERHKLSEITDHCLGKMLDQRKNKGELKPYLANINVRWGEFHLSDLRDMRFEQHETERYGLRNGDIVMCEGGEPGRCAIWRDQMPEMMIQKALHRIRCKDGIDPRFLYYSLTKQGKNGEFEQFYTGSTIKHLTVQNLAKVEVLIPPLPIQTRIADILSAYDDLIENNKRRMALLEASARELYREWFVRLRFPGHESTPIQNGLPEGWKRKKLEEAFVLQRGFDLTEAQRNEGDIPVYGSNGQNGWHDTAKAEGPGIVTGRSGTLGKVTFVRGKYWPHNTSLWVKEFKLLSPYFVYHKLIEIGLEQFNGGASVPTLDRKAVHRLEITIPARQLLNEFDTLAEDLVSQLETLENQNQKLRQARDLLLPKLMNGEIEV